MKRTAIFALTVLATLGGGALYAAGDTHSTAVAPTATVTVTKPDSTAYPLSWCLVSGETLGEMGEEPVKYNYQGRELEFCCKNCIRKFEAEPAKYIAMLDSVIATMPPAKTSTVAAPKTNPADTIHSKTQVKLTQLNWCIVSGEDIGGDMGKPVQYTVKGRTFDLCCKFCKKKIDKRPEYYIARLDSALAGQIKQPVEEETVKKQTY